MEKVLQKRSRQGFQQQTACTCSAALSIERRIRPSALQQKKASQRSAFRLRLPVSEREGPCRTRVCVEGSTLSMLTPAFFLVLSSPSLWPPSYSLTAGRACTPQARPPPFSSPFNTTALIASSSLACRQAFVSESHTRPAPSSPHMPPVSGS